MEGDRRKERVAAAVSAAVCSYISEEKESYPVAVREARRESSWSLFGRQEQMNMRVLSQLRLFRH